jgi:hypothetical protein
LFIIYVLIWLLILFWFIEERILLTLFVIDFHSFVNIFDVYGELLINSVFSIVFNSNFFLMIVFIIVICEKFLNLLNNESWVTFEWFGNWLRDFAVFSFESIDWDLFWQHERIALHIYLNKQYININFITIITANTIIYGIKC